jgi:UvrD-like helicase family protein
MNEPPIHLTEAGTMFKRTLVLGPAALLAAACSIDRPHPTDAGVASTATVAFSAVKFWEAGATVSWNQLATELAVAAPAPGINATRLYAYLALAQFRAAEAARATPGPHPPIAAAIGGASVASIMTPHKAKGLEAELVVITSCVEGFLPLIDDDGTPEEQQRQAAEGRRLFYVGVTRTRQCLVISSFRRIPAGPAKQIGFGVMKEGLGLLKQPVSRYITELGPDCPGSVEGDEFLSSLKK